MIEEKLQRLIRLEWEEFQNVHNKGSRAPCQDDRKTFWIMRSSLFIVAQLSRQKSKIFIMN